MIFLMRCFFVFLFLIYSSSSVAEEDFNFSYERIVETREHADNLFSYGNHAEALLFYYNLTKQNRVTQEIKADSWKKAGIIKYLQGKYVESGDHLKKAQNFGASDRKITELLNEMSKIKSMNNNDGRNIYVIQIGFFKSSSNANSIIRKIKPINGEFRLAKEKRGAFYVIYFDGFRDKDHADEAAARLKSLNDGMDFFVKLK